MGCWSAGLELGYALDRTVQCSAEVFDLFFQRAHARFSPKTERLLQGVAGQGAEDGAVKGALEVGTGEGIGGVRRGENGEDQQR